MSANDDFKKLLDKSPFDEIDVGLDGRYFDLSVGYNRQSGTKLTAKLDLTSIGQPTEAELQKAKIELAREQLKLQNRMLDANMKIPIKPPTIEPITIKEKVKEKEQESTTESTEEYASYMGAKAFEDE